MYDSLNRLIEEKNYTSNIFNYHKTYSYNDNSDITEIIEYDGTNEPLRKSVYNYSNTIKSQLNNITYYFYEGDNRWSIDYVDYFVFDSTDPFRPSSYKGNTLTWQGRRLTSFGDNSYTYNSEGIRTSKQTLNGTYNYYLEGNKIIKEIKPNDISVIYHYDESGMLVGFNYNNNEYFYSKDLTGSIIKIIDIDGLDVVEYKYDAYGKVLSITGDNTLKDVNSYLYKGYYYDFETSLYYCNSRYYDPDVCRWISIDESSFLDVEIVNGISLWSYCGNNPVMCRLGYNLGEVISAPISNIGSISSNVSSRIRSSSARSMSRASASSTPFANVVSMTNYSTTLVDNILFGMALGNISHTTTIQHNNSGVFYAYSNIGNSTSSVGVGLNIKDWYGLNAYVSSNIGIGSSMQLGSITFGAEVSVLDGVSFSLGTVTGNVTNETTVSIGWGTLAFAYAACGAIAATPVPMARAVAAAAVCIVVLIDIFN